MASDDDDRPLDPRAMLDIIETERRDGERRSTRAVPLFYLAWGIAWLVGYLVLWASIDGSGSPVVIPAGAAWLAFAALMAAAAVTSALVGVRMGAGIRGRSQRAGALYGWSWMIAGTAAAALGVALIRAGMSQELALLYFPSVYAIVVAALYLAGAMLWESNDQLVIAIVFAVVGSVAPFFGAPLNLLVMAIVGGGSMLAGALVATLGHRRR